YVRAFLTEVEGVCQVRSRVVRWAHEDGRIALPAADGALAARERKPLVQKLEVATRIFPVLSGGTARHDRSSEGWRTFEGVGCRPDGFTHPIWFGDLEVADDLVLRVLQAHVWLSEQLKI